MSPRIKEADPNPNQGSLLLLEPGKPQEAPINPAVVAPTPDIIDPPVGYITPVIEGWTVLDGAIKSIARQRSNRAFLELADVDEGRKMTRFAHDIDEDSHTARSLVKGTVDQYHHSEEGGPRRPTHYERAQLRLNGYRDKQAERTSHFLKRSRIVDPDLVEPILPVSASTVEHQFFYGNSPEELRRQTQRRAYIHKFVQAQRHPKPRRSK